MNWHFTRPGAVRFERGEPFCFITLVQDKPIETFDVVQRSLESEPELRAQYEAWGTRRNEFNKRLAKGDAETVKEAWQRFYFRGEMPDNVGPAPKAHVNKRRLKAPRFSR